MATADPALLDARVRAAEVTLAAHYGRTTVEHTVALPDGTAVRVLEFAGRSDAPPILLLHGIASVTALAVPLIGQLPGRRVLAIDWPGQGLSAAVHQPEGAEFRAGVVAVLEGILSHFGIDRADLIGHGIGGQFALYLALQRPERVHRLVLLGAPAFALLATRPSTRMRARAVPGLGTALLSLSTSEAAHTRRLEKQLGRGALGTLPPEAAEVAYLISQRPEYAPGLAGLSRAMMTAFGVRPGIAVHRAELARLAVPVLVVWGDRDAVLDPQTGRADVDAIPDARILVTGGGHSPWLDDPDGVGSAVAGFLTE